MRRQGTPAAAWYTIYQHSRVLPFHANIYSHDDDDGGGERRRRGGEREIELFVMNKIKGE